MRSEIKTLSDIANIQTGPFGSQLHKEDYVRNGTPIVTVEHLGKRQFTEQNLPRVSDEDKLRLKKYTLQEGDMVFSRVGSVDRVSYVDADHDGWMFSGRCLRVRPKDIVDSLYLYYFFCLEETKQFIRNIAVGATMPSINTKLMGEVPVRIPEIDVQKRIASILEPIDSKIELNERVNNHLEQLMKCLFNSYYKNSTEMTPFRSIINVMGGGTPKTSNETYWNGDIPFFTPKDVGSPYALSTEKYITPEGLAHCNSQLYSINTVFVTARGTVGKVSLAGYPMAMNQSCYALTSDSINPILVYFYTLETVNSLKHKANGGVFDAIVTRDFNHEIICKLSNENEKAFLSIAAPVYEKMLTRCKENINLRKLRDTLLPKLMSGEIDVSNLAL